MKHRTIQSIARPAPQPGTGILHPFPSATLAHIDPFVFLDTGAPRNLGQHSIHVAPHPHRGVQPVSLLFRGRIEHRDSLGHEATVTSGGMQWLVAGAGALHEEVLQGDENGIFHMAQLWINVPAAVKMVPAEHHAVPASGIPAITSIGRDSLIRLYAGELAGSVGPAPMPTAVLVAHIILDAGGTAELPIPPGWNAAFTVVAGDVASGDASALQPGATPVFRDDGDGIQIASQKGGEVLLMAGQPIGEPIVMGGGFVMTTRADVERAFTDYRAGRMGTLTSSRR